MPMRACVLLLLMTCAQPVYAGGSPTPGESQRLRIDGAKYAHLLARRTSAQALGMSCSRKMLIGAGIGAASGAAIGAILSDGSSGGIALGSVIFTLLGVGFGYKACNP
jgi:hypothetical protein